MALSDIKVRRDDDRLAHGIVKSRAAELKLQGRKEWKKISGSRSAGAMIESLSAHYGKRVLYVDAPRLKGTRAKVDIACAEACEGGSYALVIFTWRGNRRPQLDFDVLSLKVSGHAVARAMQRSVGSGDVDAAVKIIFLTLLHWCDAATLVEGARAVLRGFGGEARVEREAGLVVVRTWIDADSLPEWKQASARAEELTVCLGDENNC